MNDIAFSEHVILHLPGTGDRKVATSFEAIECLQNEWPQWARGGSWRRLLPGRRRSSARAGTGGDQAMHSLRPPALSESR